MGTQAEALARQVERANAEVIATVEALANGKQQAVCAGEGWPVCVTAAHIAEGHTIIYSFLEAVAAGQPVPYLDGDMIDAKNRDLIVRLADATPAQATAMLRTNGNRLTTLVRSLSDQQVETPVMVPLMGGALVPPSVLIERVALGHLGTHFGSIQAAIV